MAIRPYLAFAGNCRAAFTRYQEVLGGDLVVLGISDMPPGSVPPGSDPDAVMHAALTTSAGLLLGADDASGGFKGDVHGMCVNLALPDAGEAKRVFDALAEGGQVQMPISATFFSPAFGMCTDSFGTPWMIMVDLPMQPPGAAG